jgi:hypothetical protein
MEESRSWNMKKLKLLGLVGITLIALANAGWAAGHGGGGGAGPTRSEGVEKFIEDMAKTKNVTPNETEKEFFRTTRPSSLLQRFATTDEVAALVTFVARSALISNQWCSAPR